MAIHLGHSLLNASCDQPGRRILETQRVSCETMPSLFDLAPDGACRAASIAGRAVRSYRTFSPLLPRGERYVFCGAFPGVAPAGRYPASCFHGARTFLRDKRSDHPTV